LAHKFVADELIEAAQKATGLQRFDGESFREGLDVLLAAASKVDYPEMGIARMRNGVIGALATRLKTTDYLEQHPELLKRPIARPVFVFGVPRTGTTLLSNLLAADPARRSPLTWEIDDPIPPPKKEALYNDPRALARLEAERKMLAARPDLGKYYRNSAVYPNECMFFIAHDFKALMWECRGKLPEYRDWLFQADLTSTYQYHKRFLQLLQADAPGVWNLKQPSHGLWLETLLKVYPDARLVWCHRDPLTATGSFCSLMKFAQQAVGLAPDIEWLGRLPSTPIASWMRAKDWDTIASSTCTMPTSFAIHWVRCKSSTDRWAMSSPRARIPPCANGLPTIRRTNSASTSTNWRNSA
jgi:hypothetical protein